MEFADLDFVLAQGGDGLRWFLKFDGQMTGVIIDTQMLVQARIVGMFGAQLLEEADRLSGRFKISKRLRLQAKMQIPSRLLTDASDMLDATPYVPTDRYLLFG